jgi:hypothetical protein
MRIKTLLITLIFIIGCNSQNNQWVDLFDGTSMNGWHVYNSDNTGKQWSAKDGELVFNNKLLVTNEDLVTDKEYTSFELSLEWNISKGGNSGIFFGVQEIDEFDQAYKTGPEIQVLDNYNYAATEYHKAPALYDLISVKGIEPKPHGEWNHVIIKIDHNNNVGNVTFNGEDLYSFPLAGPEWDNLVSGSKFSSDDYYLKTDHPDTVYTPMFGKFKTGKIGLQDHGHDVKFRNIKIREF